MHHISSPGLLSKAFLTGGPKQQKFVGVLWPVDVSPGLRLLHMVFSPWDCLCVLVPLFYEDTGRIGLEPPLMVSS